MDSDLLHFVADSDLDGPTTRLTSASASARTKEPLFDKLLHLAGAESAASYPSIRRLVQAVGDSDASKLQKTCLLYYVVRSCSNDNADAYAKLKRIPRSFVTLVNAYWALDHEKYNEGVRLLCSPGVSPDFLPYIFEMLEEDVQDTQESARLILDLADFKSPVLAKQADLQIILDACLVRSRVEQAFDYFRTFVESKDRDASLQNSIVEKMLTKCFDSDITLASTLEKMLYIPLSPEEDEIVLKWVRKVTSSRSSLIGSDSVPLVNEWIASRLIAQGRCPEAISIISDSLSSLRASNSAHKRAQDSLKNLYSVLPPVQRSMVDMSTSKPQPSTQTISYAAAAAPNTSSDSSDKQASGTVARVPWLAAPALPYLPAPRTLQQAQRNTSTVKQIQAGGPQLNRRTDLPLSATGHATQQAGSASGTSRLGKRDARMEVLSAINKADSPFRQVTAGPSRFASARTAPAERQPKSPASTSTFRRDQPAHDSPLRLQKATIMGLGSVKPQRTSVPSNAGIDFAEEMKKYQSKAAREVDAPSTSKAQSPSQRPKEAAEPKKRGSRDLPPGAFPSSASTFDERAHSESEGDDDIPEEPQQPAKRQRPSQKEAKPPVPEKEESKEAPTGKQSRPRTTSQKDSASQGPTKKGRRNPRDEKAEDKAPDASSTAPRRSKRLGSVAPIELEENDEVENSMAMNAKNAKTLRRRRP